MKILKNLIVFLTLTVFVIKTLADGDEDFKEISEKCQKNFSITFEDYEAVQGVTNYQEIDMKFKCFAHCLAHEMDVLDAAGKLDVNKLITLYGLDQDTADKITDCKAEHDMRDEPCEYCFAMMGCIMASK